MDEFASEHMPTVQEQYGRLVSVSLPAEGIDPMAALAWAQGQPRFFWSSQRDDLTLVGIGSAVELVAYGEARFEAIQRQAADLFDGAVLVGEGQAQAGPRLFGGFAFRDDAVPDEAWSDFPPAHFVLPHYQLSHSSVGTWLTLNAHIPADEDPASLTGDLHDALHERISELQQVAMPVLSMPAPDALTYPMSYDAWETMLNDAVGRIRAGELKKVVLSRVAEARYRDPVHIEAALAYLADAYADCYRFMFEPRPQRAFYGATPELLAKAEGDRVRSMALAGSMKRGDTPESDAEFGQALLDSKKDRHEHQLVADRLRDRLKPLTSELTIGQTGLLKLSNIQHIYTPVSGTLKQPKGILPLVEALHPTPALGGEPRDIALPLISELEPVPRGWYAAPVGWIDHRLDGQFSVAIRSAVAQKNRVWMYAGAGIVADSEPSKEWDETALKFTPMLKAHNAVLSAEKSNHKDTENTER